MNKIFYITIFFLIYASQLVEAQKVDGVLPSVDSVNKKIHLVDSLSRTNINRIDSLSRVSLAIEKYSRKVDNIQNKFSLGQVFNSSKTLNTDSVPLLKLKGNASHALEKTHQVDSLQHVLSTKLDSLKSKIKDPLALQKKTDSIQALYTNVVGKRLLILKEKGAILSKEEKNFLQQSGMPAVDLNLPKLPKVNVPNSSLPDGSLNNLDVRAPDVSLPSTTANTNLQLPELGRIDLPEIPGLQQVDKIKDVTGELKLISGKAGEYLKDAKQIKEEGLNGSKNVDKLAEDGLKNIDEVQAIQKEISGADKLKQLQQLELDKITNAQQLRDHASSKMAMDKILSNEDLVKAQITKMSKYKKKFDSLPDMRYVPKFKPNSMKGKPLKERLVPGVLFQILSEDKQTSWFVAPELLYKFSGTFSGGVGGVYRLQYTKSPKMIWDNPLYGYKLIAQAKAYKEFYVRTEWENINSVVPIIVTNGDPQNRTWSSNWLVGVGRVQKISLRLNGYFWACYNLTHDPLDTFKNKVYVKTGIQFNLTTDHKKIQKHITDKIEKRAKESRASLESLN